jgi:hypothetical protein
MAPVGKLVASIILVGIGLLGNTSALAAQQGVSGKKLLLKKSGKLLLISKDPAISVAGSDPVNGFDSSITVDEGTDTTILPLPKALWSANPSMTSFKYNNASAPNGPSIVKIVKATAGKLKVIGKGASFPLPVGAATIDVFISLDGGANVFCMTFSGTGDGNTFRVKNAPTGSCGTCGNNMREGIEECDGTDSACPGGLNCQSNCTCPAFCPTGGDSAACDAYTSNVDCETCCTDNVICGSVCDKGVGTTCRDAAGYTQCADAINSAGCASVCCP